MMKKKRKTTKPFVTVVLNDQKVMGGIRCGGMGKERLSLTEESSRSRRRHLLQEKERQSRKIEASKSNGETGREKRDKRDKKNIMNRK
jgi:hypothetical protein